MLPFEDLTAFVGDAVDEAFLEVVAASLKKLSSLSILSKTEEAFLGLGRRGEEEEEKEEA